MNILALDTTTECCSAALLVNGQQFVLTEMTQRGHSALILGMLDRLFKQANITIEQMDAVAFGRGPGSFTGVRIGVGVAQGIAFARELPVIPVSSLAAVAQQAYQQCGFERLAVATDARMGEVYAGSFVIQNGIATAVDAEQVCLPENFYAADADLWWGVGTGWSVYRDSLTSNFKDKLQAIEAQIMPEAGAILTLAEQAAAQGQLVAADQALPVYLRNNVAKKKGEI